MKICDIDNCKFYDDGSMTGCSTYVNIDKCAVLFGENKKNGMLDALIWIYKEYNALHDGMEKHQTKSCVECSAPNNGCACINNVAIHAIEKETNMKIEDFIKLKE